MLDDLRAWLAVAAAGVQFAMRAVAAAVALLSRNPQRQASARALLGALDGNPAAVSGEDQSKLLEKPRQQPADKDRGAC
jgi:hypothetical protein